MKILSEGCKGDRCRVQLIFAILLSRAKIDKTFMLGEFVGTFVGTTGFPRCPYLILVELGNGATDMSVDIPFEHDL